MKTLIWLLRAVADRPTPMPPVAPGTGQKIQEREQPAARERLLAQARRRAGQHLYDRPTR
ncbi:hypothetical protein [Micromonospora deserti]|uniref:Uncharacterized protein n=1 Tax=Micromonospora deserti TaxID=2070366 RepID=A0A2W2BX65_9ACTN|nr:hypothetical protein [Micromonospora deserti]PZF85054.1 hypothetical protein C1I99_29915 [Micromonospora deserti]